MSNSEIKEDRGFQLAAASDISNKQANTKCLSLKSQSSVNTFIYLRWKQHIIEFKLHHKVVWTFKFALLIECKSDVSMYCGRGPSQCRQI